MNMTLGLDILTLSKDLPSSDSFHSKKKKKITRMLHETSIHIFTEPFTGIFHLCIDKYLKELNNSIINRLRFEMCFAAPTASPLLPGHSVMSAG